MGRSTQYPVFWVDAPDVGRIAVVGRPRSAQSFAELKAAGIDVLVSLLEADEAEDVGLADAASQCAAACITLIRLPITDHGIPDDVAEVETTVAEVAGHLAAGRGVGAHCYAGLGRSPLLVAAVLIHHGRDGAVATELVSAARGFAVPEMDSQHAWLMDFQLRCERTKRPKT